MVSDVFEMPEITELKQAVAPVLPEDTIAEAGRKILLVDFIRMLENEAGSRTGEDIEHVHHMRVATRRMRSAFRLFDEYYKAKPIRPFTQQLKRLANHLGAVRDLDVMIDDLQKQQALQPKPPTSDTIADDAPQDALQIIIARLDRKRQKARRKLNEFLDSESYQGFVGVFATFLTQPGIGVKSVTKDSSTITPHQVRHVLPTMLHEHLAAVRAYNDAVMADEGAADVTMLHALRIEFKRLRYAMSFFEDVLGTSGADFINQVRTIQDHLGRINDLAVAQPQLGALAESLEEEDLDSTPVRDYLARLADEQSGLMAGFPAVWGRFNARTVQGKLSNALLALK
jgi:CHAD domain-containing protein